MKLNGQTVTLFLSDEGTKVLDLASIQPLGPTSIAVFVEEAEELGLWIRVPREDQLHLFLLHWAYIVGIDLPAGGGKLIGMRS